MSANLQSLADASKSLRENADILQKRCNLGFSVYQLLKDAVLVNVESSQSQHHVSETALKFLKDNVQRMKTLSQILHEGDLCETEAFILTNVVANWCQVVTSAKWKNKNAVPQNIVDEAVKMAFKMHQRPLKDPDLDFNDTIHQDDVERVCLALNMKQCLYVPSLYPESFDKIVLKLYIKKLVKLYKILTSI